MGTFDKPREFYIAAQMEDGRYRAEITLWGAGGIDFRAYGETEQEACLKVLNQMESFVASVAQAAEQAREAARGEGGA